MQINWITRNDHNSLLIIALGWGASPEVIQNQELPLDCDIVIVYDYTILERSVISTSSYSAVSLIAWSFGVWASEQLFGGITFELAIAIFGTPHPIHTKYGIDPRIFALTLRGVNSGNVVDFVTRMCGRHLKDYMKQHSTRTLSDIQGELQKLKTDSVIEYTPRVNWSKFIAASDDLIFPSRSVENYCLDNNFACVTLDNTPHYPFYDSQFICTIKNL